MPMSEEELIAAVRRLRAAGAQTAAQVHAALVQEGFTELSMSQVKKASSKAMKQAPLESVAAPAEGHATPTASQGYDAMRMSKQQLKQRKAVESAMRAAESHMVGACTRLRVACGEDEISAVAATKDRGEHFVQSAMARALEAKVRHEEVTAIRERVEADLAVLEWALLAEKAGTLTLPEATRAMAQQQLERLKSARGSKTVSDLTGCFTVEQAEPERSVPDLGIEYERSGGLSAETATASVDRALARCGALAASAEDDCDID